MNQDRIEEGDRAEFHFSTAGLLVGEVLYTPQDTDDCFHIRTDAGDLWYVQHFDCARLLRKGAVVPEGEGKAS